MARVKGPSTRFPAARAFTRSRGETPRKRDGARTRSASPAASRHSSRSRSRGRYDTDDDDDDDAETIVAAPVHRNPVVVHRHDDPAAQLLQETLSVSLGASSSDEGDGGDGDTAEDERSSEGVYEEAQGEEYDDAQDVEMDGAREPELVAEDTNGRPDVDEVELAAEEHERPDEGVGSDAEESELTTEDKEDTEANANETEPELAVEEEGGEEVEFEVEQICSFKLAETERLPARKSSPATRPSVPPTMPVVLLEIKWRGYAGASNTWEREADIQASAGPLLYQFWAARGGRDRALRLNAQTALYVPFRILEPVMPAATRRRGRGRPPVPRYLVQWLGYDADEATPETERKLRDVAPALLDEFLSENPEAAFSPRFHG